MQGKSGRPRQDSCLPGRRRPGARTAREATAAGPVDEGADGGGEVELVEDASELVEEDTIRESERHH